VYQDKFSINNHVAIEQVLGEKIPVVIVKDRNLFRRHHKIDGVIGFDIFYKFEIEINTRDGLITFRPAENCDARQGFSQLPLRVVETRPVIDSQVTLANNQECSYELMIDTGSTLGLLVRTPDIDDLRKETPQTTIGYGFNGAVRGFNTISNRLTLHGLEMERVPTGIIECDDKKYASIGMEILKDYVIVINYLKMYVCLKRRT
jgi:predicted aspartyl protease